MMISEVIVLALQLVLLGLALPFKKGSRQRMEAQRHALATAAAALLKPFVMR